MQVSPFPVPTGPSARIVIPLASMVIAVAALFACQQVFDADLYWHLATGRWVLEHGSVPRQDPFSFGTIGAPWVAHSWIAATAMALTERLLGVNGLVVAKVIFVALAFGLAFWLAVRAAASPWVAAFALVAAAPIAQFQFRERPQIVMFLLVPIFYWVLAAPRAERSGRTWLAIGLGSLVWANTHGSFFLGTALALALVGDRVATAFHTRGDDRRQRDLAAVGLAAALGGLTLVASLVNAYGLDLPLQIFRDFTSFAVSRSAPIQEHQPLDPAKYPGFVVLTTVTGCVLLLAGRRMRVFDALSFAGFTALACTSVRFAAVAALLDACILAASASAPPDWVRERIPPGWLRTSRCPPMAVSLVLLTLGTTVAFRSTFAPGREWRWGIGVNESRFPLAAVDFLARSDITGNVFNSWEYGGLLLWKVPRARDLVDGRALPGHFALLDRLHHLEPAALASWISEHDVSAALLARTDPFVRFFSSSPQFRQAFFDDRAVVFLRGDFGEKGSPGRTYRFLRPDTHDPSYLIPLARGPMAAEVERELRLAVADAPAAFVPRFLLGYFLEALGRPEALEHYVAASRLNPGLAFGHYDLGARAGALAVSLGRAAELEPFLREGLKANAENPVLETLLATSLQVQRRFTEAEATYRQALRRRPDYHVALKNLGFLMLETGRTAEAVGPFRSACAAAPRDEVSAYGLALALQRSGDRAGAADAWRRLRDAFKGGRWSAEAAARLGELEGR